MLSTGQGVLGHNSFAYCGNNPVVRIDSEGEFWNIVIGAVVGAAVGFISSVISQAMDGKRIDLGEAAISAGIGAVEGGLTAAFPAAAVWISIGSSTIDTVFNGALKGDSFGEIAVNTVISAGFSYVAGSWAVEAGVDKLSDRGIEAAKVFLKKGIKKSIKKGKLKVFCKAARSWGSDLVISTGMAGLNALTQKITKYNLDKIANTI